MIKFFRKIRQKLLSENKFSKYLIYAIGEIILVVIGILIALQFNNYNEQRKHLQAINETITAIEEDIVFNHMHTNHILDFYKTQDDILKKVLNDQYTIDDYRRNNLISVVTANWSLHSPKTENLDALLKREEYIHKEWMPIIDAVKYLVVGKVLIDQSWRTLYSNIENNIEELTKRVSLIQIDSLSLEQRYTYMLTQPEYQKIAELNWIHTQNYFDLLTRFRARNMATLSTIKVVKENYSQQELERLYQSFGMNPFNEIGCSNQKLLKNKELRISYLVGNLSNEEITIRAINDGKVGGTFSLQPNQFWHTRPEYGGLDGDYTCYAEQLDHNGHCINKFVAVNKGYLLINDD